MKKLIVFAFVFVAMLLAMGWIIERNNADHPKHAYDSIATSFEQPGFRASNILGVLQSEQAMTQLNLTDQQASSIKAILEDHTIRSQQLWSDWREQQESTAISHRPFAAPGSEALTIATCDQVESQLDANQIQRLNQMVLRSIGWNMVFVESVRKDLSLTGRQTLAFKDLMLERTKTRNQFVRRWSKSDNNERDRILDQMEAALAEIDQRGLAILNDQQLKWRSKLLGNSTAMK